MIEGLTPQLMMVSMLLITVVATVLTLFIAALLLWRYRLSVTRTMASAGGYGEAGLQATPGGRTSGYAAHPEKADLPAADRLYRQLVNTTKIRMAWQAAAGLVFALVFAVSAQFVYPTELGVPGFLTGVWIYYWPLMLALPLIVPGFPRLWIGGMLIYGLIFAVCGAWAATVNNLPGYSFGAVTLPPRSSVTPETMLRVWVAVNGIPTLLVLIGFNRWARSAAPLVLSWVVTAIGGTLAVVLGLFSDPGVEGLAGFSRATGLDIRGLVVLTWILSLAVFGVIGWLLARVISQRYRERRSSDLSLLLDSLWLLFAATNSMWLVWGGMEWVAILPLAFIAYRLTLAAGRLLSVREPTVNRGLVFLRVFSLGQRSESLLQGIAGYWRNIGSIQTITGPDLAKSIVQPHQFLDFLSGRLADHFVTDAISLQHRIADQERDRDPDGRFRINSFFCHQDSWQAALSRLVQEGDSVLMDLRHFSADNAGCLHELRFLIREIPINRWLLVVDDSTNESFLRQTSGSLG